MNLFRKSTCLVAGVLIFWCSVGYGQSEIVGKWISPDGDRKMEIYDINGSFFGKIIWVKSNTVKVRVGDIVMKNIIYKNDHWEGIAYIPARDRDLPVSISMPGDDELEMTGKVGIMSRTKRWKRCK